MLQVINGLWGREFDCMRLYMSGIALGIPCTMDKSWVREKFGINVKILIIELQM